MDKIKIAVIGLNFGYSVVKELLKTPANNYFHLSAVCDLNPELLNKVSSLHSIPAVKSIDEMLVDPSIKAVALMTPPSGRAGIIRRIINSGRHVMTTKPFERDIVEAEKILLEAKELKKVVHLNSPSFSLSPAVQKINEFVDIYNLGQPIGVRSDLWAHKPHKADGSWYDDPIKCPAAPIFRIGIYAINEIIDVFGEADSVSVITSRLLTGRPTPDNAQLSLKFKNGAIGNVFVSFCIDDGFDHRHAHTFNYERGTIYWDVGTSSSLDPEKEIEIKLIRNSGKRWQPTVISELVKMSETYDWESFYHACTKEQPTSEAYIKRIIAGIRVLNAMAKADQSGKLEVV
jgi:predicted dehydrogenase